MRIIWMKHMRAKKIKNNNDLNLIVILLDWYFVLYHTENRTYTYFHYY